MKSSIPQIIVTGSSGFLGQYLLESLIQTPLDTTTTTKTISGLQIHALYGGNMKGFPEAVQSMVDQNNDTKVKVQVHQLDLTNAKDVQAWIDQYAAQLDACVHSAALSVPRLCQKDPSRAQALNVPVAFLEGLAKHKVPIIGLSTDQVYDGTKGAYVETDAVHPLNIYGTTKVELEALLTKLSSTVDTVSLRSSIMLGPKAPLLGEQAHDTFLHFCASRQHQETTFYTDECRSVIAVDNVVNVIRWFLLRLVVSQQKDSTITISGVYNMGGPDRVSRFDMAQTVFRHFGYAEDKLVAAKKAKMPPQEVQSPLDITMDSSKLVKLVGEDIQWKGIDDIVQWTFAKTS